MVVVPNSLIQKFPGNMGILKQLVSWNWVLSCNYNSARVMSRNKERFAPAEEYASLFSGVQLFGLKNTRGCFVIPSTKNFVDEAWTVRAVRLDPDAVFTLLSIPDLATLSAILEKYDNQNYILSLKPYRSTAGKCLALHVQSLKRGHKFPLHLGLDIYAVKHLNTDELGAAVEGMQAQLNNSVREAKAKIAESVSTAKNDIQSVLRTAVEYLSAVEEGTVSAEAMQAMEDAVRTVSITRSLSATITTTATPAVPIGFSAKQADEEEPLSETSSTATEENLWSKNDAISIDDVGEFEPSFMLPDLHFALCTEDITYINATPSLRRLMERWCMHFLLDAYASQVSPRRKGTVLGQPELEQFGSILTRSVWFLCDTEKHKMELLSWKTTRILATRINNLDYLGRHAEDAGELNAIDFEDCVRPVEEVEGPLDFEDTFGTVILADSPPPRSGHAGEEQKEWSAIDLFGTNIWPVSRVPRD